MIRTVRKSRPAATLKTTYRCRNCGEVFSDTYDAMMVMSKDVYTQNNTRIPHDCDPDEDGVFGVADPIKFEILRSRRKK